MSSDLAISAHRVSKYYKLGLTGRSDSLVKALARHVRHPIRGWRIAREVLPALEDVSFDVHQGDAVGIIGKNGAGKSTLLKILSRITPPSSGHIEMLGHVGSLLEVGTGFHPELTGIENVYLNGMILGMSKRTIDQRLEEIVDFAEVHRFLETPVKRYSSGMRVRLAFAVAAHLEPDVLIIDEVLSVGDAAFQKKCIEKMRSIVAEDGRTVLYVSHNLVTVENLCPRTMLLVDGRLVFDGETDEAIARYMASLPHAERGESRGVFDLAAADRTASGYERVLQRLELRPNRGATSDTLRVGDALQIVVDVEGFSSIPDAILIVKIGSDVVPQVTRMTSRMKPLRCAADRSDRERIVIDLPEVPFTPGEYHLDVRVAVDPRFGQGDIDVVHHAAEFTILPADVFGNGHRLGIHDGPVIIPWDWEIRPGSASDADAAAVAVHGE